MKYGFEKNKRNKTNKKKNHKSMCYSQLLQQIYWDVLLRVVNVTSSEFLLFHSKYEAATAVPVLLMALISISLYLYSFTYSTLGKHLHRYCHRRSVLVCISLSNYIGFISQLGHYLILHIVLQNF